MYIYIYIYVYIGGCEGDTSRVSRLWPLVLCKKKDSDLQSQVSCCRRYHVVPEAVELAPTSLQLSTTLFAVLSHNGAAHLHRKLKKQLLDMGAKPEQILVKYGFKWPKRRHMGRKLRCNEICACSMRFRWLFMAVYEELQDRLGWGGTMQYSTGVLLANNSCFYCSLPELQQYC